MIKMRNAYYCNLKIFLLYLVIYGHWIENEMKNSSFLEMQYRWIYLLHMPFFAFVSGLFLRKSEDCSKQIKRLLPFYVVLQICAVLLSNGEVEFLTPYWHLWYLLSFCTWTSIAWLYFRFGNGKGKITILILAILIALLAGYVSWIGRRLSLSRTIVFFPFFWLGVITHSKMEWNKYRKWGIASFFLAGIILFLYGNQIPVRFLYHADPYGKLEHGFTLRLLCFTVSTLLGFFCLTVIPQRRFPFTRVGADTMPVYLIHAPIVCWLREFSLPWPACVAGSAILLYLIYKILQWNSPLYGIMNASHSKGRRDRTWQKVFAKYDVDGELLSLQCY